MRLNLKNLVNTVYTKNSMRFSLKNATHESSLIRVRVNVNGSRLTYYLPSNYKITPAHWDKDAGRAIEDSRYNPDLKGNPQLQVILRNVNKEIEKTTNALIKVMEDFKLRDIHPTTDLVREKLRKELNRSEIIEKRTFADFNAFIDYYIALCREGSILNNKGSMLVAGSIRNYLSTQSALKKYSTNRRITLRLDSITVDFYNDFIKFLNETKHARGQYKPNVIGKFVKNIKVFMRYAYENGYTTNDDYKRREFKVYKEDVETVYLTEVELDALYALELPENQAHVRDGFFVSCYTGLRYSDLARLKEKHINFERKILTIVTQKTNTPVIIPIHPKVEEIFRKHDNQPPTIQCNQSTNRMIKRLCRMADITDLVFITETKGGIRREQTYEKCELVTSHTARHGNSSFRLKTSHLQFRFFQQVTI